MPNAEHAYFSAINFKQNTKESHKAMLKLTFFVDCLNDILFFTTE